MDDLNKDEHIHDGEAHKRLPYQPPLSSNSVLPETSEKIRTSAWITLAILGSTVLITVYGETMLLPAIRDIIRDFDISYTTSSTGSFPSAISYNLIFLTAALISVISITLVIILRRKITQSQSTLKKLEIESSVKKCDALSRVVSNND